MDLHFTNATASEEECATIDTFLGVTSPNMRSHSHNVEEQGQRHLLLPVLHAVQSRMGWISPGALNYLCHKLGIPPAEAYGVATFYALFSTEPQPPTVLHVCDDIACKTCGADGLCATL